MNEIKVEHVKTKKGRACLNWFYIHVPGGTYLQGHDKIIAFKGDDGTVLLDIRYWHLNKVVARHRNAFLNEVTWQTRIKIRKGVYDLVDLN